MTSSPDSFRYSPWRWWVCGLLFLATTLNYMDRVALNQMAVRIQTALSLDDEEYSRLESGFSFSFAIGAIVSGAIVDKISVRWVYPVAVLGWSAAGVLTGYASGFWTLIACRIMLGLFEAGNWPCGLRTTRAAMRPEERSLGNALFQSGTAVGAILTPSLVYVLLSEADSAAGGTNPDSWKIPFRIIGYMGAAWVALWFLTVRPGILVAKPESAAAAGAVRYRDVFRDIRFWALLGLVVGVNVSWHTYRAWLPKYLQQKRGFTEEEMKNLTTLFYLLADVGSWTIGLATLYLTRGRRWNGHTARVVLFGVCAALALVAVAVPYADRGWPLTLAILLFAFASLGLFPTYYALSQDLSSKHQGKVSGTLGACAHLFLSLVVFPIQGSLVKRTGSYDELLAVAGVFPMLAFTLLLFIWPKSPPPPDESTESTAPAR